MIIRNKTKSGKNTNGDTGLVIDICFLEFPLAPTFPVVADTRIFPEMFISRLKFSKMIPAEIGEDENGKEGKAKNERTRHKVKVISD